MTLKVIDISYIAQQFGVNGLPNPDLIYVGQKLRIK